MSSLSGSNRSAKTSAKNTDNINMLLYDENGSIKVTSIRLLLKVHPHTVDGIDVARCLVRSLSVQCSSMYPVHVWARDGTWFEQSTP